MGKNQEQELKLCCTCKEVKTLEDFYKKRRTQRQSECKLCTKIRRVVWWKSDAGKTSSANSKLKARFGLSLDDYDKMLEDQQGQCLVCGATESYLGHRLAIDHCHTTGKIRGLLCKSCNVGLGNFRDSVELLTNAISYIKERG